MTKYDGPLAEAASIIASHGFAQEEIGTVEYGPGWFAWAVVSPVLLLNVGEIALADQVRAVIGDTETNVIIREDSAGFVDLIATTNATSEAEAKWREIADEWEAAYGEVEA